MLKWSCFWALKVSEDLGENREMKRSSTVAQAILRVPSRSIPYLLVPQTLGAKFRGSGMLFRKFVLRGDRRTWADYEHMDSGCAAGVLDQIYYSMASSTQRRGSKGLGSTDLKYHQPITGQTSMNQNRGP